MRIVCGRHHNVIDLSGCAQLSPKINTRIGSKNPNRLKVKQYTPIATDGVTVFYAGKRRGVREFCADYEKSSSASLIVLTHKERNLIIEELLTHDIDISVFEEKFPIFPSIRYTSSADSNYSELNRLLKSRVIAEVRGGSLAKYFSTKNLFKVERKLRHKNLFDKYYALAMQGGYQEVFKLYEERADRVVVAFDFNSMYPSCMGGDFVNPKKIKYSSFNFIYDNTIKLEAGLYRVVCRGVKSKFFKEFHPFKFTLYNKKNYFKLSDDQSVEVLLFKSEIESYAKYFSEIEVLEGLTSTTTIQHPLYDDALRFYQLRQHAKRNSDSIKEKLYKFLLVTLHASTNPKKRETHKFSSLENLQNYLVKIFR